MTEIWKDIEGYEGLYKISNYGEVWSVRKQGLLKKGKCATGYYSVSLAKNKKQKTFTIHRLVAIHFIDNPLKKPCVNHMDESRTNNHYSNLEYASYYENNKHARDNLLNNISLSNKERWNDLDFRKRTSKNISKGLIISGCNKGKNNNRFRYVITDNLGNEYSRQELAQLIGRSQSNTDVKIREAAKGKEIDIFKQYNIKVQDIKQK